MHPHDKQAQHTYFNRLVSAAALPKPTFQQGIRDLVGLLSKQQTEVASTPSRSSTRSATESIHSTPSRGGGAGGPGSAARTPTSRSSQLQLHPPLSRASAHQTPESAQASAKKLLDPKFLATLRSGGEPSAVQGNPSSPSTRTPTRRGTIKTSSLTPGTRPASDTHNNTPTRSSGPRSDARPTLRTSTLVTDATPFKTRVAPSHSTNTATIQEVVPPSDGDEEEPSTGSATRTPRIVAKSTGKRNALPTDEDQNPFVDTEPDPDAAAADKAGTPRTATPRKKARFTASLRETTTEQPEDEVEPELELEEKREQHNDDSAEENQPIPGLQRTGITKHQALYAPTVFRVPVSELDLQYPTATGMDEEDEHPDVRSARQSFVSALLPSTLPAHARAGSGRGGRRARPTPVLSISTAEWLAPWHDGLVVARERLQAGVPGWMATMQYNGTTSLPDAALPDLQAWLVQGGDSEAPGEGSQ